MDNCGFCHGELHVGQLIDLVNDETWHRACAVQEGHVEAPVPPKEETPVDPTPDPVEPPKTPKAPKTTKKTDS